MLIELINDNLYSIRDVVNPSLVEKITNTPWLELGYVCHENRPDWNRRQINNAEIPWIAEWNHAMAECISSLEKKVGIGFNPHGGSAFWLDEPGFVCPIHTDGEMPGAIHLCWIGQSNLGTTFYNTKNEHDVRFQVKFVPNHGYAMINLPDDTDYRILQWHGMLTPVPKNTYRLTSYTWLFPCK